MSTPLIRPTRRAQPPKPKSTQRPNFIRLEREARERIAAEQAQQAAELTRQKPQQATKSKCPNKSCDNPKVVDGICRTCGAVADDSNIVNEVGFGETSSGAVIVQGSNLAADQGGIRSGFRRGGGLEEREKTIREAHGMMVGWAHQLNLNDNLVTYGTQVFKLASSANFTQGRTIQAVACVCLYAACRNTPPCKIMLIDLADIVQLNVFKLGRTFKALNVAVPLNETGMPPVLPEDLIFRFATKLEFLDMTNKVAEDAVRLVKRMSWDWMAMGRRPSGICGACLLMAARMNNFRRTIREVVYIVKVTNHTIQKRLEEFKETETSRMTVEDFLSQTFALPPALDPPSFYRSADEWKTNVDEKKRERQAQRKKRKRRAEDDGEEERQGSPSLAAAAEAAEAAEASRAMPPPPRPSGADLSNAQGLEFPRDDEGFIKPLLPSQIAEIKQKELEAVIDPALFEDTETDGDSQDTKGQHGDVQEGVDDLDSLARTLGGDGDKGSRATKDTAGQTSDGRKKGKRPALNIDEAWEADEADIEDTIEEIFNDPETRQHATAYANAEKRAHLHSAWAHEQDPQKAVSMDAEVGEDEFADDPEVMHCLLTPEEAQVKELLWINQNKDWLRQQQEKIFRRKLEADKPKTTRARRKKAPMGQAQLTPASSPGEAAIQVLKQRAFSNRINYDAIHGLFDIPGQSKEGAAEKTGRAGGDDEEDDDEADLAQVIAEAQAATGEMEIDEFGGAEEDEEEVDYDQRGGGDDLGDEEFGGGYEEDYGGFDDDGYGDEY